MQTLAQRIERSPLTPEAESAGFILADWIDQHALECDKGTIDRIFKLFLCQKPVDFLSRLESGTTPIFQQETLSQLRDSSIWKCLWLLAGRCVEADHSPRYIYEAFLAHLDIICRWFKFMTYVANLKVGTPELGFCVSPQLRGTFSRSISYLLHKLVSWDEEMTTKIYSDPQMIEVIVKTWILKAKFSDDNPQQEPSILFAGLLSHFQNLPLDQWKERILGGFDQDDHEIIIDVALNYLRSSISNSNWPVREIFSNFMVIIHLYRTLEPTMTLSTRKTAVSYIMMALKRIADIPREEHRTSFSTAREGEDALQWNAFILGCGVWLIDCLTQRDDLVPWLTWLIQAGFLRVVARCDQWMENIRYISSTSKYDENIVNMVSTLSSLCVLKSFVVLLHDELAVLDDLCLGPDNLAHPQLRASFELLKLTVHARMDFFAQSRNEPARLHLICDGPGVSASSFSH